jgi:hypothetical protein
MSKTPIFPTSKMPIARQLVIVLKNSKYTHQQFKTFHKTARGLLENADLSGLHPSRINPDAYVSSGHVLYHKDIIILG